MAARNFNASLHIGNLHQGVDEEMLFQRFTAAGFVPQSVKVCRHVVTAKSLGTAYVNFGEREVAANALETLNFQKVLEKPMRIQWSQRDPSQRRNCVGNLFIKNLEKSIDDKEFHDKFIKFGEILSSRLEHHASGESKGFGFVQFQNPDSAKKAIEEVNGIVWKGKKIYVGEFESNRQRKKQFTCIHVSKFGEDFTMEQLMDVFKQFGSITKAEVKTDSHTGKGRGFGFVTYVTHEAAKKAIEQMDGKELNGHKCKCSPAETPQDRKESPEKRKCNLYVSKLEEEIGDEMLKDHFSSCGTVTSAKVMTDQDGVSLHFGYVCFSTPDEASLAVRTLNRKPIITNVLHVAPYQAKEERQYSPHQKGMRQGTSDPVIGVQQQVLPVQPSVQDQSMPQEAEPTSANPQVVQATTPTLHYPLPQPPGAMIPSSPYPVQLQNVPPGVTFLPGLDGKTLFAVVPIPQQLYFQLQQQLPARQLTPKVYQKDEKMSDSCYSEMLPQSALPNLTAPPIYYVQQPDRLPNQTPQEHQLQYQSPYRSVPPTQMQQAYRLPNPSYQYPYRYVPPAHMQQPYSPYRLPNQASQFPHRYATPPQMQQPYGLQNQFPHRNATPPQMQQPYQWTNQEQQNSSYTRLFHSTTQMQQPYQLPSQKLEEPQPLSHPFTTSRFDSTAPKANAAGNQPEREASKVNAPQATGRPDNPQLGKEDLESVTSYLLDLDNKTVYDLGMALGLKRNRLKGLQQPSNTGPFLDDVIAAWLSKADQVSKKGNPTWRTLVNALSSERVGQNGIAEKITRDHLN